MRLASGLLCFLLPLAAVAISQQPIGIQRTNLVDQLGSDPDFTELLRLLQRARLIPALNRITDATLFAPTNSAIERYRNSTHETAYIWASTSHEHDDLSSPPDNVQYLLRQHLLYHMLNYSIPIIPPQFPNQRPLTLDTLHFPALPLEPPTDEPAPAPPWLPIPGGLLNNAPQRLRVASRDNEAWVGVDASGRGGAQVVKDVLSSSNGLIIPVNDVVPVPGNLFEVASSHPHLKEFASILTPEMKDTLSTSPHLTLFLPVDSAWSSLDSIERRYLHSGYAERDVSRLVGLHLSGAGANSSGEVGWTDDWQDGTTCELPQFTNRTIHPRCQT